MMRIVYIERDGGKGERGREKEGEREREGGGEI